LYPRPVHHPRIPISSHHPPRRIHRSPRRKTLRRRHPHPRATLHSPHRRRMKNILFPLIFHHIFHKRIFSHHASQIPPQPLSSPIASLASPPISATAKTPPSLPPPLE